VQVLNRKGNEGNAQSHGQGGCLVTGKETDDRIVFWKGGWGQVKLFSLWNAVETAVAWKSAKKRFVKGEMRIAASRSPSQQRR
jgi:hypothetical protein